MRNSLRTPTPPPPPPPLPPLPLPPTENMQKFDDVVNMSDDVLRQYDVLYPAGKRVSKKKYMDWLIYQVGKDRRDLGTIPYIVTIDIEFPMNGFHKYDHQTGVHIANVVKNDMDTMMQIGKIFRDRHLFSPQATTAMIDHDMKFVLNVEPFHAISATRGGRVVGGAVFRCHLLNTGERVIVLEMIATDKTAGRGVGTALFRALRNLSQLSVAHNGHIAAGCLQTLESVRFYDRKLPERNGCMARAIMVSLAMLDDTVLLSKHLDLRYATVFASA